MTVVLLVVGVVSEFIGIVLLAFPDFVPGALRLSGWLRRQVRRVANLVRRLFRRRPRGVVHSVGLSGGITMGGSVSGIVSTSATTLAGQVEYLLRRDQDSQRAANEFAKRLNRMETESPRRLAEARREMEEHSPTS